MRNTRERQQAFEFAEAAAARRAAMAPANVAAEAAKRQAAIDSVKRDFEWTQTRYKSMGIPTNKPLTPAVLEARVREILKDENTEDRLVDREVQRRHMHGMNSWNSQRNYGLTAAGQAINAARVRADWAQWRREAPARAAAAAAAAAAAKEAASDAARAARRAAAEAEAANNNSFAPPEWLPPRAAPWGHPAPTAPPPQYYPPIPRRAGARGRGVKNYANEDPAPANGGSLRKRRTRRKRSTRRNRHTR